jgi:hypothetical protein
LKLKKSRSPLTKHLGGRFGGKQQKRKRVYIVIALLLVVPYVGSTLAASVTITGTGSTTAIEFGQGNQVAITCDTTITSTINEGWYATGNTFTVSTIALSGIDVRTNLSSVANNDGCGAKLMTVKLFSGAAGSATPAVIGSSSATSVTFTVPTATGSVTVSGSTGITGTATVTSNVAQITLTIPSGVNLSAADVTRVSIETDNPA